MAEKVYFTKQDTNFIVKFHYNDDLVDIMRDFNGWYTPRNQTWKFPITKYEPLKSHLKKKYYEVKERNY